MNTGFNPDLIQREGEDIYDFTLRLNNESLRYLRRSKIMLAATIVLGLTTGAIAAAHVLGVTC